MPWRVRLAGDLLQIASCRIEVTSVEVGRGHLVLPVKLQQRIVQRRGRGQVQSCGRALLVRAVILKVGSAAAVLEDRILSRNPLAHRSGGNTKRLRAAHRRGGGIGKRIVTAIGILREAVLLVALDCDAFHRASVPARDCAPSAKPSPEDRGRRVCQVE